VRAVDGIDLQLEPGEIYGFLGLNGAGKTTTIRAMLGMIHPDAGSIKLFGTAVGPDGRGPWSRVGHLVERPAAYPELSVYENLDIARQLAHISDRAAVSRAIERLDLAPYTHRKAGELSGGNFQRLALARALLHQPDLLILDEPANGLDPAGVVAVRGLLRTLVREQGVTVFMSSHILAEVDRLATRIGIIHKGRLLEELDSRRLERSRARRLVVNTRIPAAAQRALSSAGYTALEVTPDGIILHDERALEAPETIATLLVNAGTPPIKLIVAQENLEDHFLRLTGGAP
jgi:ABC-2 type transport system ATP-binding protein